jgi:hypothetical protein
LSYRLKSRPAIGIDPSQVCGYLASQWKKPTRRGTHALPIAFPCRNLSARTEMPRFLEGNRYMTLFESVVRSEKFILPKQSWIIPGLTLGVSLVAVALALS